MKLGVLSLEHLFPPGNHVTALVDVKLVLEKLGIEQTRVGEWLNIIGYVTLVVPQRGRASKGGDGFKVHVQAILCWSAGPLDIKKYENVVADTGNVD